MENKVKKLFITSIVLIGVSMVVGIITLAFGANVSGKIGNAEFSISNNTKLYAIWNKQTTTVIEICKIEFREIINKQMEHCDLVIDEILRLAHEQHLKLLISKNIEDPINSEQFRAYKLNIKDAVGTVARNKTKQKFLNELPKFLKEGQFSYDSVKADYEEYLINVSKSMLGLVREEIQDNWVEIDVTEGENFEFMNAVVPQMLDRIQNIYRRGMEILLEYKEEVYEKNQEVYEFMKLLEVR